MKIKLPQVGESVVEGIVAKWLKQVGDHIEKYDPLVEMVTDKVTMEIPSPVSGVLTAILAEEGQTVSMGTAIAAIRVKGEEEASMSAPTEAKETEAVDRTGVLLKDAVPFGPTGSGGPISILPEKEASTGHRRQRYSPVVLRLAEEHGANLSEITGSGMGGRVTRKDVQEHIRKRPREVLPGTKAEEERVPLNPVRRIIADNMVKSATQIPQAWTLVEADVSNLVQLRESYKDKFQLREGVRLTHLPFLARAAAESLAEHPLLNSSWGGDHIVVKRRINIGIAVTTPDGLLVPVIRDAVTLSISELAKTISDLTNKARRGRLKLDDVQGGTFTINNTGTLGSVASQPLVNYPQAAILTTEAIVKRPVVIDDTVTIRSVMNLCLVFDHRILDGAEASAFVGDVKGRLEAIDPGEDIY